MQLTAPAQLWLPSATSGAGVVSAFGSMLRTAGVFTGGYLLAGSLAAGVVAGAAGAASLAVGSLVVACLFASGLWALRVVLRGGDHLAQAGAFAVFFLQLYVGLMLATLGRGVGWIVPTALGVGAIGAVLTWQAGMVLGLRHARVAVFGGSDDERRGAGEA